MKPPPTTTGQSNLQLKSTNRFVVFGLPGESEYRTATTATPAASAVHPGTRSIKPNEEKATTPKAAVPSSSSKPGKVTAESEPQQQWTEDLEQDYQRILSVGEECISPGELKALLLRKGRGTDPTQKFILYDGFEPSGRMHIAQGTCACVCACVSMIVDRCFIRISFAESESCPHHSTFVLLFCSICCFQSSFSCRFFYDYFLFCKYNNRFYCIANNA